MMDKTRSNSRSTLREIIPLLKKQYNIQGIPGHDSCCPVQASNEISSKQFGSNLGIIHEH